MANQVNVIYTALDIFINTNLRVEHMYVLMYFLMVPSMGGPEHCKMMASTDLLCCGFPMTSPTIHSCASCTGIFLNYIHALHLDDRPDYLCLNKLFLDKYDSVKAFEADLKLMLSNAIKFNGLDSEVGSITVTLCSKVHGLLDAWRSGANKKRKDGDKKTPQPTKKVKVG